MPSEIFNSSKTENVSKNIDVDVSENNKLIALRVERNEKISSVMSELQDKIISSSSTTEEKNTAFEELQVLNLAKGKETYLEDKILDNYKNKGEFIEEYDMYTLAEESNEKVEYSSFFKTIFDKIIHR